MPLDLLQSEILELIAKNRTPDSVAAGSSVLNQHAFRLSDDTDFFHAGGFDIVKQSSIDIELLKTAGFDVEISRQYEGMVEATIYKEGHYPTKLQWVQSGLLNFFGAVPDETFGWRLHYADLAVNKILAAGSRKEIRDFVDVWMIHQHVMPLWHALWAAPGKDAQFNPISLSDRVLRFSSFSQKDIDAQLSAYLMHLDFGEMIGDVRKAIEEAAEVFEKLRGSSPGHLFVGPNDQVISDADAVVAGLEDGSVRAVGPDFGGSLPSNPSIDHEMIKRVIAEFGFEGRSLLEP